MRSRSLLVSSLLVAATVACRSTDSQKARASEASMSGSAPGAVATEPAHYAGEPRQDGQSGQSGQPQAQQQPPPQQQRDTAQAGASAPSA
jgi:hypothetical protein